MRRPEACSPVQRINHKKTSKLRVKPVPTIPEWTPRPLNTKDSSMRCDHYQHADYSKRGDTNTPTETSNLNKPILAKNALFTNIHKISDMHSYIQRLSNSVPPRGDGWVTINREFQNIN